jgi:uncharacterized protein involved in exopolysaccharide biosynthesis
MLKLLWTRKWLVLVPVLTSTAVTFAITSRFPVRYQSGAHILVMPPKVPDSYVKRPVTGEVSDRLRTISQQVLSRTRLERVIEEFGLYAELRKRQIMEKVVQQMRDDIVVTIDGGDQSGGAATGFRVSFVSAEAPRVVQRVAERLSGLFVEENVRERSTSADMVNQFLESTAEETRRKLLEYETKLASSNTRSRVPVIEYEALQETYRSLLLKLQDSRITNDLERRHGGEQFKLVDFARIPDAPVGPSRRLVNTIGSLSGLAVGLALVGVSAATRRKRVESAGVPPADR